MSNGKYQEWSVIIYLLYKKDACPDTNICLWHSLVIQKWTVIGGLQIAQIYSKLIFLIFAIFSGGNFKTSHEPFIQSCHVQIIIIVFKLSIVKGRWTVNKWLIINQITFFKYIQSLLQFIFFLEMSYLNISVCADI